MNYENHHDHKPESSTPARGTRDRKPGSSSGFISSMIDNFAPSFFASTMGTGIVSVLLYNLPYQFPGLHYIAIVVFVFNIGLFLFGLLLGMLHYARDPSRWAAMADDPVESLYTGTLPMGFATIITMMAAACVPHWGAWVGDVTWAFWSCDAVLSVLSCCWVPFLLASRHEHHNVLNKMTAAWLLPVVAPIVCSAAGASISEATMDIHPRRAFWSMVTSYALLGMGLSTACVVLTVYFLRLGTVGLPPKETIVSMFLPLGPLGQGAFSLMHLGKVARQCLPIVLKKFPTIAGDTLYTQSWMWALLLWGFAMFWVFFAVASLITYRRFPVNKSWWAFTFPVGVVATATTSFGTELENTFFNVLGTIISLIVVALWLMVCIATLRRLWRKGLFRFQSDYSEKQRQSVREGKRKMDIEHGVFSEGSSSKTTDEIKRSDV